MPYKRALQPGTDTGRANGVHASRNHNGLRNAALERPANGALAQPVRASGLHPEGRPFDPDRPHQNPRSEALERTAFCTIPLTRGYSAIVDREDYARLSAFKWTAAVQRRRGFRVYAYRSVWEGEKCRTILLHREIMGAKAGESVDHANRNTLDNRRSNLRIATTSENAYNRLTRRSKHGFIGVGSRTRGSYYGRVAVGRKSHYTKTFRCPVLAAAARDVLAQRLHGEFAVTNFRFIPVSANAGA